jgi:hypothetical protein
MDLPLIAGWNKSLSILDALRIASESGIESRYAQISIIDSTHHVRRLPSLGPQIKESGAFYAEADDDVVVEISTLLSVEPLQALFTGFDEIWLCEEVPTVGKPESLQITSDLPFDGQMQPGLEQWMHESGVTAGFGDGDGLNFATFDRHLAELLSK